MSDTGHQQTETGPLYPNVAAYANKYGFHSTVVVDDAPALEGTAPVNTRCEFLTSADKQGNTTTMPVVYMFPHTTGRW